MKKIFAFVFAAILTVCLLCLASCGAETAEEPESTSAANVSEAETAPDLTEAETAEPIEETIGTGVKAFLFTVTKADGSQHVFHVSTNKTTVGDALCELGLIGGDEDQYGLYVKVVDGVTADYDDDGTYWAFYIDGAYASAGISRTEIDPDASYEMRIESM